MRVMAANHASQLRVTQLLKANRFKMNGCLDLITVYQRYLKWVLRLKCEIRMTRWLADCPASDVAFCEQTSVFIKQSVNHDVRKDSLHSPFQSQI